MAKKIIVSVDTLGGTKIEAEGFHGTECKAATQSLELLLGAGGSVKSENKPEYYEGATTGNTVTNTRF